MIKNKSSKIIFLIGWFKLVKGILLALVGFGVLSLLGKDISAVMRHWIILLHADPENHIFRKLLNVTVTWDYRKLEAFSAGIFFYSALLHVEGIGLLNRKKWAKYFTIIITTSFIPLEIFEITKHVNYLRIAIMILNVWVVWYLIKNVKKIR